MLKKDAIWFGIVMGMVLPALCGVFIFLVDLLIFNITEYGHVIHRHDMILISIFINLLPIRIYFVNLKYDRTGRGVLLVTFIMMILFFIFIRPL